MQRTQQRSLPLPSVRFSLRWLLLASAFLASFFLTRPAEAASSVTASKDCSTSPGTVVDASFTLGTPQVIAWNAIYTGGMTSCNGISFYLSQVSGNQADIALTTTGAASGTQFLPAGTYHISIHTFLMGSGMYTVTYDRTATIGVSPTSHNFGTELEGDSSTGGEITTFNVIKSGDLDITGVTATVDSGAPFFQITTTPGTNPPTSFKAIFNAGTISSAASSEAHAGTIRVKANSNPAGATVPDVLINVSGTTLKRAPNIVYIGTSPSPIKANFVLGQHQDFSVIVKNTGTKDLIFTSPVTVTNDSAPNIFTEITPATLDPLAANSTRSEGLRFTPPTTSSQDQSFSGHITVFTNDPNHPALVCPFTAIAHEPRPIIRIDPASNVINYHSVELGYAYDQAIVVHNDGDAPLVFNVTEVNPADPDRPQWESLSTVTGATIAAGGAPNILVQRFKPNAVGGPYDVALQVVGTNHPSLPPPATITLTGTGTAPIPVNSVLVLDRSGSMADSAGPVSKIAALRVAGQMWTDLLRPETGSGTGDAIGIVKYNDTNQEYVSLKLIDAPQRATVNTAFDPAAITDINRLQPDSATGIGGAMQRAAGMLTTTTLEPANSSIRKHVMVVLTDGIENRAPYIDQVLPGIVAGDSRLRIYSLGLGNDADPAKLQSITNRANGFHQVTGDLSGTARFDLQTFYFKILVDALDWQMVVDPTYAINLATTNAQIVSVAHVCSSDLAAMFVVMDEPALRSYYTLQLMDPNGNVMTLGANVGGVPIQVIERENYRILKVVFPDISLSGSYIGDWKLLLVPNGQWKPRTRGPASSFNNQGGNDPVFNGYNGLAPIGFGAAVGSNYRLDAQVSASAYQPNATVTMTAQLSDRDWPSVTGSVTVEVTKPDGVIVPSVTLYDDGTHGDATAGDGTWTGTFGQTGEKGSYKFFFNAIGHNDRGELAPRQATRYVSLVPADQTPPNDNSGGKGEDGCIPCRLLRWLWAVVIILLLVLIILARRRNP